MPVRSFMISPAIISPATDGTKAVLPGTWRRAVHFRCVPGGQTQCVLQLISELSIGVRGFSLEYTTFSFLIPRFFNSYRITRAKGQTEVL